MERKKATDFPQELLNLFDLYVHGDIDRRAFLEGSKKFAGGGLTAAAIWESLNPNYAWAQQVPKDDARIKAEYASVDSPQGNGTIKGYLARPAKAASGTRVSPEAQLFPGNFEAKNPNPRRSVSASGKRIIIMVPT